MSEPFASVMQNAIFRVSTYSKRKPEPLPSEIPTLKNYTANLVDVKWLRLAARRRYD